MSVRESLEDSFASPARARSLLTVRAAISFARFVDVPRSLALSLMCSYCRSRLLLQAFCGMVTLLVACEGRSARRARELFLSPREVQARRSVSSDLADGLVLDVVLGGVLVHELVHDVEPLAVGVVDPHERLPLVRQRVLREDRLDRALGLAGAAVDALLGIDDEHPAGLVDAVDRADVDARLVFDVDAGLGDDVGHTAAYSTEAVSSPTMPPTCSTSADLASTWSKPAACAARSPAVSVWFV